MKYRIPVENIEELRKKAATIQKKAAKHGCTVTYKEVGEELLKVCNGFGWTGEYQKYIVVEAEGEAKADGWVFVGTIEHHENGNILRSIDEEHQIPERYRNAEPYCEHCHTKRARKDTYVVFNEETGEFKQVGKSCLKEFTNGLSLEMTAMILQWLKTVEESCSMGAGAAYTPMYKVTEVSAYFVETMRKFGWANSSWKEDSTKNRAMRFYRLDTGDNNFSNAEKLQLRSQMNSVDFNPEHVTEEYIKAALDWAKAWDEHEYNEYRDNLKVIAGMEFCEWKHLGYLASLFMVYDKEMEKEIKRAERQKSRAKSQYIGQVGDKISCKIASWKMLTGWETQWGYTYMYEFVVEDGNILIWKTSKWFDDEFVPTTIAGTIKAHNEFNGVKQTVLTRCKVA